ncbi:MAG: SPOR domain-containing protein [Hyphomicrobiales bacterium]
MKISRYIRDLIAEYDCVIIPQLGAFISKNTSAYIQPIENSFLPPSRKISFNFQIYEDKDQVLINEVSVQENISFDEAEIKVLFFVKEILGTLDKNQAVVLPEVGKLIKSSSNEIDFIMDEDTNLNNDSFGLSSFISPAIIRDFRLPGMHRSHIDEHLSQPNNPNAKASSRSNNIKVQLKRIGVAASLLLLFGSGLFFTNQEFDNNSTNYSNLFHIDKQVPTPLLKASNILKDGSSAPVNKESITPQLAILGSGPILNIEAETNEFQIIAGSFTKDKYANRLLRSLKAKGYNARITPKNNSGKIRVAYDHIKGRPEALELLNRIRADENPDAWLLKIK